MKGAGGRKDHSRPSISEGSRGLVALRVCAGGRKGLGMGTWRRAFQSEEIVWGRENGHRTGGRTTRRRSTLGWLEESLKCQVICLNIAQQPAGNSDDL